MFSSKYLFRALTANQRKWNPSAHSAHDSRFPPLQQTQILRKNLHIKTLPRCFFNWSTVWLCSWTCWRLIFTFRQQYLFGCMVLYCILWVEHWSWHSWSCTLGTSLFNFVLFDKVCDNKEQKVCVCYLSV